MDAHLYHGFSPEEREQVRQFHRRMLANLYQIGGDRRQEPLSDPLGPPPEPSPQPFERKCDLC